MPDPINAATEICVTQNEYSLAGSLATSTQSCSRPIEFYYATSISVFFFLGAVAFTVWFLNHRRAYQARRARETKKRK